MSLPLSIQFDSPSPTDCPVTFSDLVMLLNALISGELEGSFLPYVTGAATPAVDDQDKVWHRTDAQGRPVGTFVFYSGTWRKQYSQPIGALLFYSGDPSVDFAGSGGLGTVGGEWDGWALCNGNNGTDNLSDKFIVGAKMDDLGIGYPASGDWNTTVSGTSTTSGAGVHEITLDATNTYAPAKAALVVGHWGADGNTPNAGADLIGLSGGGADFNLIAADAGNPTPPAIPTLPPYFAYAIARFVGYS